MKVTVESNREEYTKALVKAVQQALSAIGRKAASYAKKGTPVDTGRLRNSITWATSKRQGKTYTYKDNKKAKTKKNHIQQAYTDTIGTGVDEKTVVIGSNVEYARKIEEGGQGYGGAHMLRNAISSHKDEYRDILQTSLEAQGITDFDGDFADDSE